MTKDTPWYHNWATHRAVDRDGLLHEFNVKPVLNDKFGNWLFPDYNALYMGELIGTDYQFTPTVDIRVKESDKPNFHTLPCGTKIPGEGLKAWIGEGDKGWVRFPTIIIGYNHIYSIVITKNGNSYKRYALIDPTVNEPEIYYISPRHLLGKYIHYKDGEIFKVTSVTSKNVIECRNIGYYIHNLPENAIGWSETMLSCDLKPFYIKSSK